MRTKQNIRYKEIDAMMANGLLKLCEAEIGKKEEEANKMIEKFIKIKSNRKRKVIWSFILSLYVEQNCGEKISKFLGNFRVANNIKKKLPKIKKAMEKFGKNKQLENQFIKVFANKIKNNQCSQIDILKNKDIILLLNDMVSEDNIIEHNLKSLIDIINIVMVNNKLFQKKEELLEDIAKFVFKKDLNGEIKELPFKNFLNLKKNGEVFFNNIFGTLYPYVKKTSNTEYYQIEIDGEFILNDIISICVNDERKKYFIKFSKMLINNYDYKEIDLNKKIFTDENKNEIIRYINNELKIEINFKLMFEFSDIEDKIFCEIKSFKYIDTEKMYDLIKSKLNNPSIVEVSYSDKEEKIIVKVNKNFNLENSGEFFLKEITDCCLKYMQEENDEFFVMGIDSAYIKLLMQKDLQDTKERVMVEKKKSIIKF